MRIVTPEVMDEVFAVTDAHFHREAVVVPLSMEGEGKVRRFADGRWEITLPDADDRSAFLAGLPERMREAAPG